ncbi:hypothetical protein JCM8547_007720 [Rhodosporidiobolus lusitaniae]
MGAYTFNGEGIGFFLRRGVPFASLANESSTITTTATPSSAMQTNLPNNYRAVAFEKPGAPISIRQVEMKQPRESVRFSLSDEILRNDLVPSLHYPIGLGQAVCGMIVNTGSCAGSSTLGQQWKVGDRIAGIKFANGVAEYARVHTECAIEIKKGELHGREHEAPVLAYDAGRVLGSYRRCQREWHALDENERRMIREINERIGFVREGAPVVFGRRGHVDAVRQQRQPEVRVMLVAISNRWTPNDYGLSDRDVLYVDKDNVGDKLKQAGGANLVICVNQPRQKFEELLNGLRYNADVSILSPSKNGEMQLPLGNILAKALRVQGPPILTHKCLEETCRLVKKHNIRAPTKQHRFDQNELN